MSMGGEHEPMLKWFLVSVCVAVIAGCGGPPLGEVTGVVTIDGEPAQDVTVTFSPDDGPQSFGRTDEQGNYELHYAAGNPGAVIGSHKISIETYRIAQGGVEIPERLPAKYHRETELTREVKSGKQQFDFELESE